MYSQFIENMLLDEYMKEAEYSVTLGETLDMKANIWLVVITFLAAQTAYFLSKGLSGYVFCGQVASALLLIGAALLSLWELMPRRYLLFTPSEGAIQKKLEKLRDEHKESAEKEKLVESGIVNAQMQWAKERTAVNMAINHKKSALIDWSFWLTAGAVILNFATLATFFKLPSS
jgi:hypothetical protein